MLFKNDINKPVRSSIDIEQEIDRIIFCLIVAEKRITLTKTATMLPWNIPIEDIKNIFNNKINLYKKNNFIKKIFDSRGMDVYMIIHNTLFTENEKLNAMEFINHRLSQRIWGITDRYKHIIKTIRKGSNNKKLKALVNVA